MMKKKLLLIVPSLQQGGQERVSIMTAKSMKIIYDIRVVIFNGDKQFYASTGIEVYNIDVASSKYRILKFLRVIKRVFRLTKLEREWQPDFVYSFGMTANLVNVLTGYRCIKIIGVRGYGSLDKKIIMRYILSKADVGLCCSKDLAYEMWSIYGKRNNIKWIWNPIDIETIRKLSVEDQVRFDKNAETALVIHIGRVRDVKGLWHLIKAVGILKNEGIPVKLIQLGEGECGEYMQLAERLGIENDVYFLGPQKNPFCYLKEADVLTLPSISEGFPNVLLEAMSLGIPVVATDCHSGPREILAPDYGEKNCVKTVLRGSYGVLIPPLNPHKNLNAVIIEPGEKLLAEAIKDIVSSKDLQEKLGAAGKERVKEFSMNNYVANLDEILNCNDNRK